MLSTTTIDRYGDSLVPDGFDLTDFKRNPVLIANHQYGGPEGSPGSVGRWVKIGVEDVKGVGRALVGTCEFMRDDDLAERWWQRFVQGVAAAFSVGFIVRAHELREIEVGGKATRVRVFTDMELLEVSCVTVPANPDAVVLAASVAGRSLLTPEPAGLDDVAALLDERGNDGDTGGGGGGMSARRVNKVLSRSLAPLVRAAVAQALNPYLKTLNPASLVKAPPSVHSRHAERVPPQ